ncbi:histamine H1 receptor isoform X2 [Sorex araneus]|uniref:histamine H1 receptor isoform X2 n=1 Tax=Sorex araneus TaxID=42254 RepID=UPI002433A74B|nr:histamine H1 receptor isoform X2 [Sorex araneus]XP_054992257.1 histamine H1 receptor isoform X2 [Sorex araneus]
MQGLQPESPTAGPSHLPTPLMFDQGLHRCWGLPSTHRPPNSSCLSLEDQMCPGNRTTPGNVQLLPLAVVLGFVSLATVGLNVLVLYAVHSERKLHTVGNLYIISLSAADLIVGAVVMPMNILYLLQCRWSLGRPLCLFWLSMDYVASTASIFSVFILCIDRYRSVQHPLRYLKYRTKTRALATILGAWFLAFLWVIPILGWRHFWPSSSQKDQYPEDQCDTDFYDVTWFKVMTAIVNFYLPTVLMLWFYARIYKAVRRHCRHRELANGALPFFSERTLRAPGPRPARESTWAFLKRKSGDTTTTITGEDPGLASTPSGESEGTSPVLCDLVGNTEADPRQCLPLSLVPSTQPAAAAEGGDRSQRQDSGEPGGSGASEVLEDSQVLGDSQSVSRTDSDTFTEPGPDKSQARGRSSVSLGYLKFTWKRLRSHSRQYVSGLHLSRERKAAKQLGFIMAAFILCWIPYFIFFMVIAFCESCCNSYVHMFTIWLGYINSTLNPLIYPLCNENFKKTFKKILHIPS